MEPVIWLEASGYAGGVWPGFFWQWNDVTTLRLGLAFSTRPRARPGWMSRGFNFVGGDTSAGLPVVDKGVQGDYTLCM
jgi:hypothetical protein